MTYYTPETGAVNLAPLSGSSFRAVPNWYQFGHCTRLRRRLEEHSYILAIVLSVLLVPCVILVTKNLYKDRFECPK